MSTEKLKRVCMLLREQYPENVFPREAVEQAIMVEIGTCRRTIHDNWEAITKIGFIRGRYQRRQYFVTNKSDT